MMSPALARNVSAMNGVEPSRSRLIRVLIATNRGPTEITSLVSFRHDSDSGSARSMMHVWQNGTKRTQVLGPETDPNSYDRFVRPDTGVIAKLYGRAPYAMEVSDRIDTGESWQAAVLLAHEALARGRLSTRNRSDGVFGILAWATGVVQGQDTLGKIECLREKLESALPEFRRARRAGAEVVAFVPERNAREIDTFEEELRRELAECAELMPVATPGQMFERLGLRGAAGASPFRGLLRFEPEDHAFFFGRRQVVDQAIGTLVEGFNRGRPFLLISGSSGAGKSSLARAGIMGDLQRLQARAAAIIGDPQRLQASDDWTPAIVDLQEIRGETPLAALAAGLTAALPALAVARENLAGLEPSAFAERVAAALPYRATDPIRRRLLLLVDHLERATTGNGAPDAGFGAGAAAPQRAFEETLKALIESGAVWVIATIRDDFKEKIPALLELANGKVFIPRPPHRGELREMIELPMKLWGLTADTGPDQRSLIEHLVDDAAKGSDPLPLLQYVLDELFRLSVQDESGNRVLSWATYDQLGGLSGAIGRRVDDELVKLGVSDSRRRNLEEIVLNLAQIDYRSDRTWARQAAEADLRAIDAELIELLIGIRVVVRDGTRVRVAHEALLTGWPFASEALNRAKDDLLLRDRLEQEATQWREASDQDKAGYLRTAKRLTEAVGWLKRYLRPPESVIAYIDAAQRLRVEQGVARLAADEQRVANHLGASEFQEAAGVLDEILAYLETLADTKLVARRQDFARQRDRVGKLARFYAVAREADTFAGEEDFGSAIPACKAALGCFDLNDTSWWEKLPTTDLDGSAGQVRDLEQEVYRTLLLYAALQIQPAVRDLPPRWPSRVQLLGGLLLLVIGAVLPPQVVRRGGFGPFRLPTRLNGTSALALLNDIQDTLTKVRAFEQRDVAVKPPDQAGSRTTQFVQRLVDLLIELASGPEGAPIDYSAWLPLRVKLSRPEPINAVDYFFMGLLNFFVAKRKEAWIRKVLVLFRGQFPDLDGKDLLGAADRLLRSAVALEPRNFWAQWVLGRTLLTAEDFGGAELAFNAAVSLRPQYARGYEQRALAIAGQWAASKAEPLRRRALQDSNDARDRFARGDPSIFWPRGELFERLGDRTAALDSYGRWLLLEENIPALLSRSSGLSELERRTSNWFGGRLRIHWRRGAADADALAVRALVRFIQANARAEDTGPALIDANAALSVRPDHVHALTAKGMILLQRGEPAAAVEPLQRAIALSDAVGERNFRALVERARALEKVGARNDALEAWAQLASIVDPPIGDRRPPWMVREAKESLARLQPHTPGDP